MNDLIYSLIVAIVALHAHFIWNFAARKEKTKLSISYWIKNNWLKYLSAWFGMALWLMLIDWNTVFAAYKTHVVAKVPVLEALKAHAVAAFIAGYFNTSFFSLLIKKFNLKK
jgi:hypothetical protein